MQNHHPPQNIESLSDSISAADDPDVDTLLEQYNFEYILAQVKRLYASGQEDELKDIAQEIYILFWRKLQKGSVENPRAYIARMIRNKYIDGFRQRKR
ncbi:MAG: hypothetical protein JO125_11755, partial [Chloroflexi bacterium]|nr:hypothetical protein [Chloroflexota bacterium]